MTHRYLLPALLAFSVSSASAQDTCSDPLVIAAGTHTVVGIDGTDAPLPQCSTGNNVATGGEWYLYTATADYSVTISTDLAQNGNTDTRVQIYAGTCSNLTCIGGDDDSGAGLLTVAVVNVLEGQSVLIAWDNGYSSLGFDFTVSETPWDPSAITFTNQVIATSGNAYGFVDMTNDGYDDVVSVSQTSIRIHHQQPDASFLMVDYPTTPADYTASWSMAAGDLDGNGYLDLLYGGGSGVTFMHANDDGTGFTETSGPQYVFSQRSNMVDINNDGHLDAFVCHDVQPNVFYMNDGLGNLSYTQGGLGDTPDGGNYGSIWIDYDNDHDIDLFIAKCRGGQQVPASVDQMHRNNGDGTFTEVAASLGFADYQQSWSSAWGDFDNDGDMDVFIGASSFAQGGHKLMRNDGATFTEITTGSGLDLFGGTSIEWVTHDFDNDGWVDIFGASNTIHHNNADMTFTPQLTTASSGPVGDANQDGYLDVLNGGTLRMNTPNGNNWIRFNLAGTVSNANGIGARVEILTAAGTQIRDIKSGDGFRYMSFIGAHFGLGEETEVEQVTVYWPSGVVDVIENPAINGPVLITESLPTAVAAHAVGTMLVGPNPVVDVLTVAGLPTGGLLQMTVLDLTGRAVLQGTLTSGRLDVSSLATGQYVLSLGADGAMGQARFMKQ